MGWNPRIKIAYPVQMHGDDVATALAGGAGQLIPVACIPGTGKRSYGECVCGTGSMHKRPWDTHGECVCGGSSHVHVPSQGYLLLMKKKKKKKTCASRFRRACDFRK